MKSYTVITKLSAKWMISKIIVCILTFIVLTGCNNDQYNSSVSEDDWAFLNKGQTIENSKGIKGIDVNIIPAWEITQGDDSIVVAVADTGTDISCDELKHNILTDENNPNSHAGWDFYNNDNSVYDDILYDYHGTYISSIIIKIAPKVKLLPVKFMESSFGTCEDAVEAIRYAIDKGAQIINCSWNFSSYDEGLYKIIKDNPAVLFVCAASNSNLDLDKSELYPCSYNLPNIITVNSVDNRGDLYDAGGYGNAVDISAPGVNVKVNLPENEEDFVEGTSVSAAFVSGAAALMMSEDHSLSAKKIKDTIILSAKQLDSLKNKNAANGYLDIYACLLETNKLS